MRDAWYYNLLLFIHVAAAITAVGSNVTYGVWNARVRAEPEHLRFVLAGIKFLDDRVANPAYGVLFLSGLAMVFAGRWSITSLWLVVAIVLFIAIAVLGFAVFTPLLRRQIELAGSNQTGSPEFVALSRRSAMLGPALGLLVVVILAMMVFKPTL